MEVSFVNVIRISYGNASIFLVHQLVSLCPPVDLFVPVTRAAVAHSVGNECPNIGFVFGQYSFESLRCLNYLFAMFKLTFLDVLIVFSRASCCL